MRRQSERRFVKVVEHVPANFCGKCRDWIESQKRVNLFDVVDGKPVRVVMWVCPGCKLVAEREQEAAQAVNPLTTGGIARP